MQDVYFPGLPDFPKPGAPDFRDKTQACIDYLEGAIRLSGSEFDREVGNVGIGIAGLEACCQMQMPQATSSVGRQRIPRELHSILSRNWGKNDDRAREFARDTAEHLAKCEMVVRRIQALNEGLAKADSSWMRAAPFGGSNEGQVPGTPY